MKQDYESLKNRLDSVSSFAVKLAQETKEIGESFDMFQEEEEFSPFIEDKTVEEDSGAEEDEPVGEHIEENKHVYEVEQDGDDEFEEEVERDDEDIEINRHIEEEMKEEKYINFRYV